MSELVLQPVPEWMAAYDRQPAGTPHDLRMLRLREHTPGKPWPELKTMCGDLTEWHYSAEVLKGREESTRVRVRLEIDMEIPVGTPYMDLLFDLVELFYNGDPMMDYNPGACLWHEISGDWLE